MSHFRTSQVTLSTTRKSLGPVGNRTSLQVLNTDPTITVYLGPTTTVSSTTGFPLLAGAAYKFETAKSEVWAVAASGTPVVAQIEEFER